MPTHLRLTGLVAAPYTPFHADCSLNAQAIARYIRRPAGAMPGFSDKVISDQEVADIYAYLKTIPAPKPVKDIPLLNQLK